MTPTGSEIVVDASAIVRGTMTNQVEAVTWLERISSREVAGIVPDHFYAEVTHALRRYIRAGLLGAAAADERLSLVLDLPLTPCSSRLLAREALALTQSRGVSAYDARYLALALGYGVPLVTADRRLAAAAGGSATLLPPV